MDSLTDLREVVDEEPPHAVVEVANDVASGSASATTPIRRRRFDPERMFSYSRREALELRRDPIRLTLALLGSLNWSLTWYHAGGDTPGVIAGRILDLYRLPLDTR